MCDEGCLSIYVIKSTCDFFFNDTATTEIYTLSLHDALPIFDVPEVGFVFTAIMYGQELNNSRKSIWRGKAGVINSKDYLKEILCNNNLPVSPGCAIFRMVDLRENLLNDIPSPTLTNYVAHGAGLDLLIYLLTAINYPLIAYIQEPLSFFRSHNTSISFDSKNRTLMDSYCQARVWFSTTKYSSHYLERILVRGWFAWMFKRKEYLTLNSYVSRFLFPIYKLRSIEIILSVFIELGVNINRLFRNIFKSVG